MAPKPSRRGAAAAAAAQHSASRTAQAVASTARPQKVKTGIMAVGVAAVIMVGTLTGAFLKQDKQKEEAIKEFREVDPSYQIRMLEGQRKHLQGQLDALQRKMDVFKETAAERKGEK